MEYDLLSQSGDQGGDNGEDPKKPNNGNDDGDDDPLEDIVRLSVANYTRGNDIDDSDVFNLRFLEFVHQALLLGMEMLKMHGQYAFGGT